MVQNETTNYIIRNLLFSILLITLVSENIKEFCICSEPPHLVGSEICVKSRKLTRAVDGENFPVNSCFTVAYLQI